MATIAPPFFVEAPSVAGHRYGLFSVSVMPPEPTGRWQLGVEWEPIEPSRAAAAEHECVEDYSTGWPLSPVQPPEAESALPFIVVGSYTCGAASRSLDDARELAMEHLLAGEERAVEWVIATGAVDVEPSFQGATDLTPTSGAVSVADGVALIESHLGANHHSVGAIHAPRLLGPRMAAGDLVERRGERMETFLGTLVAFGGGYDLADVGPAGAASAAGERWIFGTARPTIRRGAPQVIPDREHMLNRDTNQVRVFAWREYVVGWDPVTVAVRVESPEEA